MKCVTAALLGDPSLGGKLAKKGTESDMAFYNLKRPDCAVTYIHPARYPERLPPLVQTLAMADCAVLVVAALDRTLGEQIVALDNAGIARGAIILDNYITREQVEPFAKGTALEKYDFLPHEANAVNDWAMTTPLQAAEGPAMVPVDHYFNVKGVGTVALGCVRRGTIRQHDEVEMFPTGKKGSVRSIQVLDDDVKEAVFGDRVGLALKGIEVADMERGCVLGPAGSCRAVDSLDIGLKINKFWKGDFSPGKIVHIGAGLQVRQGRVESASPVAAGTAKVLVKLDRPVAAEPGQRVLVLDLDSKGLRLIGWAAAQS